MSTNSAEQFDAVIVGAGISGMYQLIKLRQQGLKVRVFETGDGVGGTWYWNRYPGARFDSESYSYAYSFSEELLEEWDWDEHFAGQPETLRYLNHVADKFDLRKDIQFNSKIKSATYNDNTGRWLVETEDGSQADGQFLITAIGPLSAATMPNIPGIDDFNGESWHTAEWPHEPVSFEGKRIGVIGTGATGVQTIQEVAKTAKHLTVFQRRPNWCAPLHNSKIKPEEQADLKKRYPEIFKTCLETTGCFLHSPTMTSAHDATPEEREALYEKLYAEPGFGVWVGAYYDTLMDDKANQYMTDFISNKIRQRVKDPEIAKNLIPTDHGYGTRRVPLETNYYEVYNQDNVELVNVKEHPIERVTAKGVKTDEKEYELDMLFYATGFDGITGSFDRIDIRGEGGAKLKDKWDEEVRTYLGIQVVGFPNMFTLVGPQNTATLCNIPRCIEQNVEWVSDTIKYMTEQKLNKIEPKKQSEDEWTKGVVEAASMSMFMKVPSWISGQNSNVEGKDKPRYIVYMGGAPLYREVCENEASSGYSGFNLA
ncbi:MAG: NAD(P)/FAD-dependent oxidoreductase [Pseudomonadales bacterium]|nr:NAD(P)/FAD-dependent oxidoreductase [Pseudomonadales bacterium]